MLWALTQVARPDWADGSGPDARGRGRPGAIRDRGSRRRALHCGGSLRDRIS